MSKSFVGRQAIYNDRLEVHAYELLYRGGPDATTAQFVDGEIATAQVLANAFLEIGAQRLVGDALCFVNLTGAPLRAEFSLPLPADRVVAEILENVEISDELVHGVERLKAMGVAIALDDYVKRPGDEPLLHLADYVKIDVLAQTLGDTARLCDDLRRYDVKLLAEKVETLEQMKACQALGFEYYQGFFLTRPEVIEGKGLISNRAGLLRLLSAVVDPNADLEELDSMIGQDPALVYKLLLYANSAKHAPAQSITAIGQVLVMLGLNTVRKVISLLVMLDLDDKPGDLLPHSLIRAKMCELIAERSGMEDSPSYYTVGLFSAMDAMLGKRMEDVLEHLSLAPDLEDALLHSKGKRGEALACVRAFEEGHWAQAIFENLGPDELSEAYADSVDYTQQVWLGMPRRKRRAA